MKKVSAIIVAGGSGTRMGTKIKKQYLKLNEKEIIAHTVERFETLKNIEEIIVVTSKEDLNYVEKLLKEDYKYKKIKHIVAGGKERQDSVYNGLAYVGETIDYVLIHDGARPFITHETIEKALAKTFEKKACIVAVPVKDTIKKINKEKVVEETPNRETLWSVQTPQIFEKNLIQKAYEQGRQKRLHVTDDSMLVEALGEKVYIVEGEYTNIKITTPEDLVIAKQFITK